MVAMTVKDRKPFVSNFVAISMVEEIGTLALYLRQLQLRDRFGGILDLKKYYLAKIK